MQSDWAAEHLQVIRTLMERSAIYRRALTPVMTLTGCVGLAAAGVGWWLPVESPGGFIGYWLGVSIVALIGAFLLVRRQALKESEPMWSPPARRVVEAILPPLVAGMAVSLLVMCQVSGGHASVSEAAARKLALGWVPIGWVILYGCASHAAGFFMPRGIKLFGWGFLMGGCLLFALGVPEAPTPGSAHSVMGFFFGGLHLAYGGYLYITERRKKAE